MSYDRELTASDDLSGLPEALVANGDTLVMLVNGYELCRHNFLTLRNALLPDSRWARVFNRLRPEFYSLLRRDQNCERPFKQSSIEILRAGLIPEGMEGVLVRAAALLSALSHFVADELRTEVGGDVPPVPCSAEFGGKRYLVTRKIPSAIVERVAAARDLPRLDEQIASMLSAYHPRLRITPTEIEGRRFVRRTLSFGTETWLRHRLESGNLKIAISPLTLDAEVRGHAEPGFPPEESARFLVDRIENEASQLRVLAEILERCHRQAVSILLLPELRVPPDSLGFVRQILQQQDCDADKGVLLVVAGSWHVQDDRTGRWVNRATILDHRGDALWSHDKLAEHNLTPHNVRDCPELKQRLGITDLGGIECIQVGGQLELCDTPLGRLAVAICCGFFHQPLERLLIASGADIFLVPAMTPKVGDIDARAKALVRSQHASTFVANCGAAGRDPKTGRIEGQRASFYRTPASSEPQPMPCPSGTGEFPHVFNLSDI